MKPFYLFLITMPALFTACEEGVPGRYSVTADTIPPLLRLTPGATDTVILQVSSMTLITHADGSKTWLPGNSAGEYVGDDISVLDDVNGDLKCVDYPVEISGYVNNRMPGVYTLTYNATDPAGNKARPLIRNVCVVESNVAYLNGDYEVVCSNTLLAKGDTMPAISSSQYTVHVSASLTHNNQFDLSHLKIGDHYVKPFVLILNGNTLAVHFYDIDFNTSNNISTGTLTPTQASFTVETEAYLYSPSIKYNTRNVFKKIVTNL